MKTTFPAPTEAPRTQEQIEEDDLRTEMVERFKAAKDFTAPWEEIAREDYRFALGDQWTDKERLQLDEEGRPALTFNRIAPLLNLVSGYQRENSARIKVNPEGGEDRIFSEIVDRGLKHVEKINKLEHMMSYWFDDGNRCGKGWLQGYLRFDKDPILGDIAFRQRSPYQILLDPDFTGYDINDGCAYLFLILRLSREQLYEIYPDKKNLIRGFVKDSDDPIENGMGLIQKEGSDDDYGNRPNVTTVVRKQDQRRESGLAIDDKFTLKEYWRPKMVERHFVIDAEAGLPKKFKTKEEAETFATTQGNGIKVIARRLPEMHSSAMVAGHIVEKDAVSEFEPFYSGYPFFRFIADWAPNADSETLRVQGLTRLLKDPQKEKNKAKSQHLHILNTQANSGWIGDKDALTPEGWKALQKMGSKPGITVRKKKGSELREIQPKGPQLAHIQREQAADEEFTQISAINPDLLGFQQGTQSGRAIAMRVRQAVLGLSRIFANYRYSKEILGTFILESMPIVFDARKLRRVVGEHYLKTATDPQKDPNKKGIGEGALEAYLTIIKDHRYDVYVSEADANQTIRNEIFTQLSELIKAGAPVPMELVVDYMDLPNSEEVKSKIREEQQRLAAAAAAKKQG